ncbi:MAG: hypothetical protein WC637_22010, partial [Victivallales bacterium]
MSFTAKCDKCNATCTAEDDWLGQEAECPECGATIIIRKAETKPGLSIRKTVHQEPEKTVMPVTESAPAEKAFCPHCGQQLGAPDAVICIGCGI